MPVEIFFYKKEVDWSLLHAGLNIPVDLQGVLYDRSSFVLNKGDSKKVKFVLENNIYVVTLMNIKFDEAKYPTHSDLVQIRYATNSEIAKTLRLIFNRSFTYLEEQRALLENKRQSLSVPLENREYLVVYLTDFNDVFNLECITSDEVAGMLKITKEINELELEQILLMQDIPSFLKKEKIVKIRKLDRKITDRLKQIYQCRCQICGQYIGEKYDAEVIHSHHIDYFSTSLNNNANNILIVCPNHHGIIHTANPQFDRNTKRFIYPNGYEEELELNVHL
jgi:hypothetical protein